MKIYSIFWFPAILASLVSTASVKAEQVSNRSANLIGVSTDNQNRSNLLAQSSNPGFTTTSPTTGSTPLKLSQGIPPRVIKLRLSDTGISIGSVIFWGIAGLFQKRSTDWVRLEINGNEVKVVHTTRTTNTITQFSKWWDHPVRKIAFKPDSCTNSSDCVVVNKENGIIDINDISLLSKGEFKIEYLESGEWKYVDFRVPAKE
ncbi:hypothetical protein [Cylindrospermopsis raciborskii]|uniref:hypothetical protein n=1 Tax=Cylindrospermopsis raciborskii TaxID=77022 RepID=UPI0021551FC8|nr:hypothetical protein [Cylindrospermopsis raciborskii]